MSKRITVEQVVKAFEQTGLKPRQGNYFRAEGEKVTCACGLGAIYIADHDTEETKTKPAGTLTINEYFRKRYGSDYRLGFVRGFDGDHLNTFAIQNKVEYTLGFEDGVAACKAVMKEG